MTYTTVPTVTDGDDLIDDWGQDVSAAVAELQAAVPEAGVAGTFTVSNITLGTGGAQILRQGKVGPWCFIAYSAVFGTGGSIAGDVSVSVMPFSPTTDLLFGWGGGYMENTLARYPLSVYSINGTTLLVRPLYITTHTGNAWVKNATSAATMEGLPPDSGDPFRFSFWWPEVS